MFVFLHSQMTQSSMKTLKAVELNDSYFFFTSMGPCIVIIFQYISNTMQRDRVREGTLTPPLPGPPHLPNGKANFEPNPSSYNTPTFPNLIHSSYNHLPMKMGQCVPKRQHTKFRRRGITQKKAYIRLLIYSEYF